MTRILPKLSKKQWIITAVVLVLVVIGFNELRKASGKKKDANTIAAINSRMSSGNASATELVDLNLKRNAILNQI